MLRRLLERAWPALAANLALAGLARGFSDLAFYPIASTYIGFDRRFAGILFGAAHQRHWVWAVGIGSVLGLVLSRRLATWVAPLLLTLGYAYWILLNRGLFKQFAQPPLPPYGHDGFWHIRVLLLMKSGLSYYQALLDSPRSLSDAFYFWRPPALHYLWYLGIPNSGTGLMGGFLLLGVAASGAAYLVSAGPFGLVAMQLCLNLFLKGFACWWGAHHEYWGGALVVMALAALRYRRRGLALALVWLAALIRELFIVQLFVLSAYLLVYGGRCLRALVALAAASWTVAYLGHLLALQSALQAVGVTMQFAAGGRLGGGPQFLMLTLQFGATLLAGNLLTCVLVLLLALGAGQGRGRWLTLGFVVLPMLAFLKAGAPANDYWGAVYLLSAAALAPLTLLTVWAVAGSEPDFGELGSEASGVGLSQHTETPGHDQP